MGESSKLMLVCFKYILYKKVFYLAPYEKWTKRKPNIYHLRVFGVVEDTLDTASIEYVDQSQLSQKSDLSKKFITRLLMFSLLLKIF